MSWLECVLVGFAAVVVALILGVDIPTWGFACLGLVTGAIVGAVRHGE